MCKIAWRCVDQCSILFANSVYGSICGASFVLIAGAVVLSVTYVKCKPKGNCHGNCALMLKNVNFVSILPGNLMNIQMNRNDVYDEINKGVPTKEEMEACPAYGQVL